MTGCLNAHGGAVQPSSEVTNVIFKNGKAIGVATKNDLKNLRGIFLVICFTFGMIFTPPDVISQFLLAVPMYFLFELGLIFSNDKKTQPNSKRS